MSKKVIIDGMSCNHCVNHVKEAFKEISDTVEVIVSLEEKSAIINEDLKDEDIKEKIEDAGYDVVEIVQI